MSTERYRWYLSARAVRQFAHLERLGDPDDEAVFDRAEHVLGALCARAHQVRSDHPHGLQTWRAPRPQRYRLIVQPAARPEGPLPQLIDVLPAHAQGQRR